ncbi:12300_t:CDS:2, partial [Acaulospora morrowiae]
MTQRYSAKKILAESVLNHEIVPLMNRDDSEETPYVNWFKKWKVNKALTCGFADLPSWLQDNSDIHTGYRRPTFSYIKCIQSLFYLHNESVNIWSHFVGAVICIFFSIITYFYLLAHPSVKWWDFVVLYCFFAGAFMCLALSSAFHTFCNHSEKVCANWNRCDYVGIVGMVMGSSIPMIYYGFYCHNTLKILYFTMVSLFGIATVFVALDLRF